MNNLTQHSLLFHPESAPLVLDITSGAMDSGPPIKCCRWSYNRTMNDSSAEQHWEFDRQHIWHPYSAMHSDLPVYPVESARGVRLRLSDGRELIDGMASWWCVIHGYNHPEMNAALEQQLQKMSHVMFGGLTHQPAIELTQQLIDITPEPLQTVFFSDSGSVSVEVAMKMAIQYWHAKGQPQRQRFISLRSGYRGDTFGAMSVCDPVTGMHNLFKHILPEQVFVEQPRCRFGQTYFHYRK